MESRHPNHPGELSTRAEAAEVRRDAGEINARARAMELLKQAGVPFLVGGAYAFAAYTGIFRDTKDLDLFPRKRDALRGLEVLAADGWRTERTDELWIYKAFKGEWFVDLIFNSGNGVSEVDDEWFRHAPTAEVMGQQVLLAPVEEMILSKAFVLERERYDGADVVHLLKSMGPRLDWRRMLARFDRYWEVLLSHLMVFRFAFPSERAAVPDWVMVELLERTRRTLAEGNWRERVCRGPLLSRVNYGLDIRDWGYQNGRAWDERERLSAERKEEAHGSPAEREASSRGRG